MLLAEERGTAGQAGTELLESLGSARNALVDVRVGDPEVDSYGKALSQTIAESIDSMAADGVPPYAEVAGDGGALDVSALTGWSGFLRAAGEAASCVSL